VEANHLDAPDYLWDGPRERKKLKSANSFLGGAKKKKWERER